MNVLILNGNSTHVGFEHKLQRFGKCMGDKVSRVATVNLMEQNINFCTGCWTCWWKTPGKCAFTDDMEHIYPQVIKADVLVFATPLVKGFESALIKKTKDRLIPLIHCYIEIIQGECHHKKRYKKYPDLGFLYQPENDTDPEDIEIIKDLQKRLAINFHGKLRFFESINKNTEELAHALING